MRRNTRAAGALVAALVLAAAAACTGDAGSGADDADAGKAYDDDRLADMANESARLLYELESAENRIIQHCLERRDFTVHDQFWFSAVEPEEQDSLLDSYSWGSWLPEADEAAEFGTGGWAMTDEGRDSDAIDAYYAHEGIDPELEGDLRAGNSALLDNGEFEALSPQEQYDWYAAFYGEALAASEHGHLVGAEAPTGGSADTGGIDVDDFAYVAPEPGGCQREMIDALYDDLRLVEETEADAEYRYAYWEYRPENPVDDFGTFEEYRVRFREAIAGVQGALVDCLAERGHPGWEFDEEGALPVTDYFYELYEGPGSVVGDFPDLPEDAPADYEGKKAFEIAFAVDLAACGDETGFRETADRAWEDMVKDYYLSIETSVYAWQDEIRDLLAAAQDVMER
ncbi:hypothetical protein K3N28_11305 [Glycomyces sp. TRM65418]|uniref:hypothetical protein n=1 Tax=Glycomyces sp. TRM65418 TaxID=2867006 RepID=UPI001CE58638|nr:hypothetical protein [Glycomyces sp. TRM65418]MCC3763657.1 hypothetical protein [Glycomyces sp. TRM65418]QZD57639.1 hypothetical protein K3N28_11245 [Glycomyces sp. TRM65418]